MAQMEEPLQYSRHLTQGDEIRLLRLEAGHREAPLKATIHYHHLADYPDYEALSYTWGSSFNQDHPSWSRFDAANTQHKLYTNDGLAKVNGSLHSALVHLRKPTQARTFWIDVISIDQSFDEEKTWQIQQMREIYERATRVVIWLGPSDATSNTAMSVLQAGYRYQEQAHKYSSLGATWVDLPRPNSIQEFNDQLNAASFGKMFGRIPRSSVAIPDYPIEAVANLLNRAYWGRGWCWQECTVAKKIVIVCGEMVLEDGDMCIQTFLSTWDLLKDESGRTPHSLDHRPWSMMELRRSYRNIVCLEQKGFRDDPSIQTPDAKMPLSVWAYQNPDMTIEGQAWMFRDATSQLSMKELLKESSTSWVETSYRQDQIYALIGMATDAVALGITIDCSLAWEKVYTQLTVAYAKRGDLWFLHYCQGTLPGRSLTLPSWVPDWAQGYRGAQLDQHYVAAENHLGTIETDTLPDVQEVDSRGLLRLRGIIVDEVIWVSSERFPMSVNLLGTIHRKSLYRWIREVALQCSSHGRRAIWMVMIANSRNLPLPQEHSEKLNDEEKRELLDRAFDSILERDDVEDPDLRLVILCYLRCFMQATGFRCIIRTKNGRLGLCHVGTKRGDRVAAFMGVETTFMLRLASVSSGVSHYRLLGESYVHELMEDDQLKANSVVEDIVLE